MHVPEPGRPSLILDLLEPLRPLADLFVLRLCQTVLGPEHFTESSGGAWLLNATGRQHYFNALTEWRQDLMTILDLPKGTLLWPDTPIPEAVESCAELGRHLALCLGRALHQTTGTPIEVDHPASTESDQEERIDQDW